MLVFSTDIYLSFHEHFKKNIEKFKDTEGVIGFRKSQKERQCSGQKDKERTDNDVQNTTQKRQCSGQKEKERTDNDVQNTTQKIKDWATLTPLNQTIRKKIHSSRNTMSKTQDQSRQCDFRKTTTLLL